MTRKVKNVFVDKLPPELEERRKKALKWVKENKAELDRQGRLVKAEIDAAHHAMQLLKAERERRGLSLAEVARAAGMDKGRLSKLENDIAANPTFSTVTRIAAAMKVKIEMRLTEAA